MEQLALDQAQDAGAHRAGAYLTFNTGEMFFALSIRYVRYIAALSSLRTRTVPSHNGTINTVFDYEGKVVGLYPLRQLVNAKNNEDDEGLIQLLKQRRQDHLDWIHALQHSISTGAAFEKAKDAHQCPFGVWYDQYTTESSELAAILKLFDKPHQLVHSVADRLLNMAKDKERVEEAIAILNKTRDTTLHYLIDLFDQAIEHLQNQANPVVLVLEEGNRLFALELERISDIKDFGVQAWLPDSRGEDAQHGYDGFFRTPENELFLNLVPHALLGDRECDFAGALEHLNAVAAVNAGAS